MVWAIEVEGLAKTYPGGVRALDGVTFSVEEGTVFGLLGPNGAGKSTTVKILTTLSTADEGRAVVAGFDVAREPERVRAAIGVVGQKPGVDPDATGRENVKLQGDLYGMPRGGPRVLFLDEPTTGLDPEARADMWAEIERLSVEGVTVLLTTHYLEEADRLASQ